MLPIVPQVLGLYLFPKERFTKFHEI
jgi:hypothetical protein